MDISDKDKFEMEKRNDNPMNYPTPSMSSDWRFGGANLTNKPMLLVPTDNPMAAGSSSCSSVAMVDSYAPTTWDQPASSQNLGFCDINVQSNASTSSTIDIRRPGSASLRGGIDSSLDAGWNPPSSMLKGGIFLPNASGILPQSIAQFPADSSFIERAARFSCFNGNFGDIVNPFGIPEPLGLYPRAGGMMEGPQEVFTGSGLKSVSGGQPQKNELNGEASKDTSLSVEHRATEGSPLKNERKSESLVRSHDEAKQGVGGSGNESDEAEFSGSRGQEELSVLEGTGGELSAKGFGSKKRKRNEQDTVLVQAKAASQTGQTAKGNTDNQQKAEQTPTSTAKNVGKNGKQGSQASDPPKEEYIHVRARRGQATNSHSLAERVRREKISERMKFLQDLVPGCSKVTGKAVMLDEIINYVQSLQRQVEFLSMKLATVNPRLDFNIEGLLEKNILQSRAGPSSSMGISPDMPMAYPPLHPSQHGLIPTALPGLGNPSDVLRRSINCQLMPMTGGFKEPNQLPGVWDDELHNVVQMTYGSGVPPNNQDANVSLPAAHMKVEP